jgi:SAM-dependent methyltransferase
MTREQQPGHVPGTQGYERVVDRFIEASQALKFEVANNDFLEFLPPIASRVLDAGSGAGQNAAALAKLGHSVIAVEPMLQFLEAARSAYSGHGVTWIHDSLPSLTKLGVKAGQFDFVLVDAVWHHLDETEQLQGIERIAALLDDGGVCAISLRNGPAGAGTHVHPTSGPRTAKMAQRFGLDLVLHLEGQPSLMKNKPGVSWSRIALKKRVPRLTPQQELA